jgi:hypothetical protein
MDVASLARTIKVARKVAAKIAKDPEGYGVFKGLSKAQRKQIINW